MGGSLPLIVLYAVGFIAIFYFMAIRPQQRQRRAHDELVSSIKPGDEVITAGGLFGTVKRTEDAVITLTIAKNVDIRVARKAVAEVVSEARGSQKAGKTDKPVTEEAAALLAAQSGAEAEEPARTSRSPRPEAVAIRAAAYDSAALTKDQPLARRKVPRVLDAEERDSARPRGRSHSGLALLHLSPGFEHESGPRSSRGLAVLLEAQDSAKAPRTEEGMKQAISIIEDRVNGLGVAEPEIQRQGQWKISVQLPGIENPQEALDVIGKTAVLDFYDTNQFGTAYATEAEALKAAGVDAAAKLPATSTWSIGRPRRGPRPDSWFIVESEPQLTGSALSGAQVGFDSEQPTQGRHAVQG